MPPASATPIPPRTARLQPVLPVADAGPDLPLHDSASSRRLEAQAQAVRPAFSLMADAGEAVARLGQALAPHSRRAWVLAGPGNNGGDGLVAATHWHRHGWQVRVHLLADPAALPADARRAWSEARAAGVPVLTQELPSAPDWHGGGLLVDALLGLGQRRAPQGALGEAVRLARQRPDHWRTLAVDVPTGLCADTGQTWGELAISADATLSLLTLKPGLFTGMGRDVAGQVWLDRLGVAPEPGACGSLVGGSSWQALNAPRLHRQHKGSFGDLWVIAGGPGMLGAAWLAARAGGAAGAGRVFLAPLDRAAPALDLLAPELMVRGLPSALDAATLEAATVVCGCGGGDAVAAALPPVLAHAGRLVLDADALNALARDPALQDALRARQANGRPCVITPHPLEAARLLGQTVQDVQGDRRAAAQALSHRWGVVALLKGSGTVVASPADAMWSINPTGSARLAMPGSGDVLAGWIGGLWAQHGDGEDPWVTAAQVTRAAAWLHGRVGEGGPGGTAPVTASQLVTALGAARQPGAA